MLASVVALMLSLAPAAALPVLAGGSTQQTLINQDRAGAGLAPLAWSDCLASIAVQNAERMAAQGFISHTNGASLDLDCGIGSTQGGENVAYWSGGIDDAQANTMFMNSPPHRANIMGPYTYVATAWAVAANGYGYIAVEFLGASSAVVPSGYHPLAPARILDTRYGTGGVPAAPIGAGSVLSVQVSGRGGVPSSGVSAVVINVTVTDATAASYLTVYPAEDPRPSSSNLNWTAGETVPNLVEVGLQRSGQLSVYNSGGSVDVIFDVAGYVSTTTGSAGPDGLFEPLVPARLLDTRNGTGGASTLGPGSSLQLQVSGRGGVPASGAAAVVLNVTATNATAWSHVTVFPAGIAMPLASNLNFVAGQTVPNRVVVKLGSAGQISMFNLAGTVDLVADVVGWFTDGSNPSITGGAFTAVTPARILDTRIGLGGYASPAGAGSTSSLTVAGYGGVPLMSWSPAPTAVVLNVTVTNTSAASYLTVYPSDAARPGTSDLNWTPGMTVPNLVVVKLGADGKINLYNLAGRADLVVDVTGWYD